MHPVLATVRASLLQRRQSPPAVSAGQPRPDTSHERLVTVRLFDRITDDNRRYDLIIRVCPACKAGYVVDITNQPDKSLPLLSESQYRTEIKPYTFKCNTRGYDAEISTQDAARATAMSASGAGL